MTVFFSRPLGKALTAKAAIEKGEAATFNFAGVDAPLSVYEGSSSGGGRASKTATQAPKKDARGGRGGRGGSRGVSGNNGIERGWAAAERAACESATVRLQSLILFFLFPVCGCSATGGPLW